MDFSLLMAIKYDGRPKLHLPVGERPWPSALIHTPTLDAATQDALRWILFLYDLSCQYKKNFRRRLELAGALSLDGKVRLDMLVGKWHLKGHADECFVEHSLNFMTGAGQVEGEVVETIWSELKGWTGILRNMTPAHFQEVLDDIVNFMNWTKLQKTGESILRRVVSRHLNNLEPEDALVRKYRVAIKGAETAREGKKGLERLISAKFQEEWGTERTRAEDQRGSALRCYDVKVPESTHTGNNPKSLELTRSTERPDVMVQIEKKAVNAEMPGVAKYLKDVLALEDLQYVNSAATS